MYYCIVVLIQMLFFLYSHVMIFLKIRLLFKNGVIFFKRERECVCLSGEESKWKWCPKVRDIVKLTMTSKMRARALPPTPKVCRKESKKTYASGVVSKVTGHRIALLGPQQKLHRPSPPLQRTSTICPCCVAIAEWLAPLVFPAARPTQAEGIIPVTVAAILSRQPPARIFSNGAIM